MRTFAADIRIPDDTDIAYGEGNLVFIWPDVAYGNEGLQIDLEGHCSRLMPVRSGQGPPEFVNLERDRVILKFSPTLAEKLELDQHIAIDFAIGDQDFEQLKRTIAYLSGCE